MDSIRVIDGGVIEGAAGEEAFHAIVARAASFWSTGVAILAGLDNDPSVRVVVTGLTMASLDPPIVAVSLADRSRLPALRPGDRFVLQVLDESHEADAKALRLATRSVALEGALAAFTCRVSAVLPAGDHRLVVADVEHAAARHGRPPTSWRRSFWRLDVRHPCVADEATLERFIADWTAGRLPKREWTHGAHVAACAYLAWGRSTDETFDLMKPRILAYNAAVGTANTATGGYHETLTRFWALVIVAHLREHPAASRWCAARSAVERFGEDRDLQQLYYRRDVVRDSCARTAWVPPDRQPKGWPELTPATIDAR